jgi:hypothetical protein
MFRYIAVGKTPANLEPDAVYVNEDFELASLLCPCGCAHKITLLYPDGHTVDNDGGYATVSPSIGVWDAPCRSHFYITRGHVDWCPSWSDERIQVSMAAQRQRHLDTSPPAIERRWYLRAWDWVISFLGIRKR